MRNNTTKYQKFLDFIGTKKDSNSSQSLYLLLKIAFVFLCFIIVLEIGALIYQFNYKPDFSLNSEILGQIGDFFGGVLNPIFTFLTFIGLMITIILQQQELELTRDELSKSAQALEEQVYTQKKQRFENTFFSLLEQHNKMLSELNAAINGRRTRIIDLYESCFAYGNVSIQSSKKQIINYGSIIQHYFIFLYQVLKFIDQSSDSEIDKKFYSNIIRACLDIRTLQLLAINCFPDNNSAFESYRLLIERYEFLEHMPFEYVHSNQTEEIRQIFIEIFKSYDKKAFGNSIYIAELSNHAKISN